MLRKVKCSLMYRWCMVNAYIMQECNPVATAQWLNEADAWQLELWRIERGLV